MSFLTLLIWSMPVLARTYDVYRATEPKGSFCSVIGGACAADPDFDGAFFQNPAALTASGPTFDFDFDFDLARNTEREPGVKGVDATGTMQTMGAIAVAGEKWGLGLSYARSDRRSRASLPSPQSYTEVRTVESQINFPLGLRAGKAWHLGVNVSLDWFHVTTAVWPTAPWQIEDESARTPDISLRFGALYQVLRRTYLGMTLQLPTSFTSREHVRFSDVDSQIFTRQFVRPVLTTIGVSQSSSDARTSGLLQLDLIGENAGASLFADNDVALSIDSESAPAKGRSFKLDAHLGARHAFNERWTGFAGTYSESARVAGSETRIHATAGVSYKVRLDWSWWDVAEFMAGFDGARDYQRWILTFR